jgi:hypothetical protein
MRLPRPYKFSSLYRINRKPLILTVSTHTNPIRYQLKQLNTIFSNKAH